MFRGNSIDAIVIRIAIKFTSHIAVKILANGLIVPDFQYSKDFRYFFQYELLLRNLWKSYETNIFFT